MKTIRISISLCVALLAQLTHAHDHFASAELIANNTTTRISNEAATNEAGEPAGLGYRTQWYRYVAPAKGNVRINTTAPDTATGLKHRVRIYRGTKIDSLNGVNAVVGGSSYSDLSVTFPADAGMEFRIMIASTADKGGTIPWTIQMDAWPFGNPTAPLVVPAMPLNALVANDEIDNAKTIPSSPNPICVLEYIDHATQSNIGPEPMYTGYQTVWYKWIAPKRGIALINTPSSSLLGYIPVVTVYQGPNISSLNIVFGADGGAKFPVEAGMEYKICMGVEYGDDSRPLLFTISTDPWPFGNVNIIKPPFPTSSIPANDYYETATSIPSALGTYGILGYSFSATSGTSEVQSGLGYNSLWYKWKAPEDSEVVVRSLSSTYISYTHALGAFTGSDYDSSTFIAYDSVKSSTDGPGEIFFSAKRGVTYHLSFSTGGENIGGPFFFTMQAKPALNIAGPTCTFQKPSSKAKVSKRGFYVYFTVGDDPQGVANYRIQVNGGTKKVVSIKNKGNYSFRIPKVKAGRVTINIEAKDGGGLWGKKVTRSFTAK